MITFSKKDSTILAAAKIFHEHMSRRIFAEEICQHAELRKKTSYRFFSKINELAKSLMAEASIKEPASFLFTVSFHTCKMRYCLVIGLVYLFGFFAAKGAVQDSLIFKGQLSAWSLYNPENTLSVYSGIRYLPNLNYHVKLQHDKRIDFEASINLNGTAGFEPFDTIHASGQAKIYRLWARYSNDQLEVRMGLQKINFGSASILRPLMWFDQIDPRDPLQFTDGVWGLLGRYYFLNNANLWLWILYGNKEPKTWEIAKTNQSFPEVGGRLQLPVPKGEAAVSYHFRIANTQGLDSSFVARPEVPENRIAIDGKWDVGVGLWTEGAWINKSKNTGVYTNEEILNLGADYTFAIGNGLYVQCEQLLISYDEKPFAYMHPVSFTGFSLSYPLGIFSNLSAILYYDWTNNALYNFINLKKDFKKFTVYIMTFMNPDNYQMPLQENSENLYAGKGIQVMVVYNH
jgi:hypothetical protein